MEQQHNHMADITKHMQLINAEHGEVAHRNGKHPRGKVYTTADVAKDCGVSKNKLLAILRDEKFIIRAKDVARNAGHTLTGKGRHIGLAATWRPVPNLPNVQTSVVAVPEKARAAVIEIVDSYLDKQSEQAA